MDYLWAGMLLTGILYGAFSGNLSAVNDAILSSGKEAIAVCITTAGVLTLWMGLMEIAQNAGLIASFVKWIRPLIFFLFPKLPKDHPAVEHISLNFIVNMLGLNWGATPAGLKAMEALEALEKERGNPAFLSGDPKYPKVASDEMCTFLIINISSLQLIPVNILAYRQQYGSADPGAILVPALLATLVNSVAAVIFCKLVQLFSQKKNRKS